MTRGTPPLPLPPTAAATPVLEAKHEHPPAARKVIEVPDGFAIFGFQLRKGMRVDFALPEDLKKKDVERLNSWLLTLTIDDLE